MSEDKELAALMKWSEEVNAIALTIDDDLPAITRHIMANDIRSAQYRESLVREGKQDAETALMLTGSYARCDLALRLLDDNLITREWLLDEWPDLWRSSDPDDTDPRFLAIWKEAFDRNDGCVTDEAKSLPRRSVLTIWRGQRRGDPLGFSWSLNREIAEKFARGASFRTANPDPYLVEARVPRGVVLAYLTGRGEAEIIIDPSGLTTTGETA